MASRVIERCANLLTRLRGASYLESLYHEMHARGAFHGRSWRAHVDTMRRVIPQLETLRILDYGCGPLGGLRACFGDNVIPYDPYVAEFAASPWGRRPDVVFSGDVLEHMTQPEIDEFLRCVRAEEPAYIFLNISTRPAHRRLPNRANAHLTVKPASWWFKRLRYGLSREYKPVLAEMDMLRSEGTFCFRNAAATEV